MRIAVAEVPILEGLAAHATLPIAFEVRSVLEVRPVDGGLGGIALHEVAVTPWVKDYDALRGEGPLRWARRFDLATWGLLAATCEGDLVGGAVLAHDTPGLDALAARRDVVALWDLRVAPAWRRGGVGRALFRASVAWARGRGASRLDVETQNVNVAACRFYAAQGAQLASVDTHAYPELPGEVRLVWSVALDGTPRA